MYREHVLTRAFIKIVEQKTPLIIWRSIYSPFVHEKTGGRRREEKKKFLSLASFIPIENVGDKYIFGIIPT